MSKTRDSGDDAIKHELEDFLEQDNAEIAAEYERIFRRSTEDPGTAGDEGEENWADLLRQWLPSNYQVVTKGTAAVYGAEAEIFPDMAHDMMLEPGWQAVAERIDGWLTTRGL